jgi:Ca2+-binding EF-hand superfamily protein
LNDDGRVSASEIKRIIESRGFYVTQKEADQVIKKFDNDGDGQVTFNEVSVDYYLQQKLLT